MRKQLDAALEYAAMGWPVFPCLAGMKIPAVAHGVKEATTDPDQLRAWFGNGGDLNVAIATGGGMFAFDVDKHREDADGEASLAELCDAHGELPETCESRTPSGGRHLFFRCPADRIVKNTTGKIAPGLDTRGPGGYVVAAPSQTELGRYEWFTHPSAVPPAMAPNWLLDLLVGKALEQKAAEPAAVEQPTTWRIREGSRNSSLTSRAGQLRRIGACREAIYSELSVINRQYCVPPLGEDEVRTISESIAKCAPAKKFEAADQKYRLVSGSDLDALPPLEWVCKGVFPTTGLAAVYGPSGSGKSFVVLDMCAAIADGRRWFGSRTRETPCTYVALEGVGGIRQRVLAWRKHNDRPSPDLLTFILEDLSLTSPTDVAALAGVLPKGGVVVVDTLNRAAPGCDENSSQDMGLILAGAKALHVATEGLVVLVHHTGKDHSKGARGHSSLFAALDAAILVDANNGNRTWKIDKNKDGVDGIEHSFALVSVDLGLDADGDPVSSCVVSEETQGVKHGKPLTVGQREAELGYWLAAERAPVLDDDGSFAGVFLDDWRKAAYDCSTAENQHAKVVRFGRARSELCMLGRFSVKNDVYKCLTSDAGLREQAIISNRSQVTAGHNR